MRSAGVIGWPVAHSKSPLIHRFWLAKLGLDGDYGRFAVAPEQLGDAIRALPALGLAGVNVTVPHKVAVMPHLDRIDDLAARVGAVNTVVVKDGALVGYNTDVAGFIEPLNTLMQRPGRGKWLDLIGTGGAARAVAAAWHQNDSGLTIYARDRAKAAALGVEVGLSDDEEDYPDLSDLQRSTIRPNPAYRGNGRGYDHVIVNATTLGMAGQPALAINLDDYPDDTIVYDLVYAPLETPLLAAARARGLRTIDGLAMLIGQAATAFVLFFGAPAPREHDAELRALLTA